MSRDDDLLRLRQLHDDIIDDPYRLEPAVAALAQKYAKNVESLYSSARAVAHNGYVNDAEKWSKAIYLSGHSLFTATSRICGSARGDVANHLCVIEAFVAMIHRMIDGLDCGDVVLYYSGCNTNGLQRMSRHRWWEGSKSFIRVMSVQDAYDAKIRAFEQYVGDPFWLDYLGSLMEYWDMCIAANEEWSRHCAGTS